MINQTELTSALERSIGLRMKAVDRIMEKMVEPLKDIGNPEKLIGKPYDRWTPEDLRMLVSIYGQEEPNPLSDTIFKHEYDKVKDLEEAEL